MINIYAYVRIQNWFSLMQIEGNVWNRKTHYNKRERELEIKYWLEPIVKQKIFKKRTPTQRKKITQL